MARTKLNPNQTTEDTLEDADGDTKIQVEESSDEDKIRFDVDGTEAMIVDSNGRVGIGTSSPSTVLHAYADVSNAYVATIDNDQSSAGHGLKVTSDGNGSGTHLLDLEAASTTVFRFRADGRLGIGTTTPGQTLTVEGDIGVGTKIIHKGDSDTFIEFDTDLINIECGGRQMIKFVEDSTDKITINNGANDIDLQVKGSNQANLIRTDAANDKVGLGTSSPAELLTLNATEPNIQFTEDDAVRAKIGINDSDNLVIENQASNKHIVFKCNDAGQTREGLRLDGAVPEVVVNQASDSLVDFRVESNSNTHMLFVDGGQETVGINTSTPKCSLSVAGSMAINVTSIGSSNDPGTTYTVAATDCVILVNTRPTAQGGIDSVITITLPDAASFPGRVVTIKDSAGYADVNAITISRAGSDTINGIDATVSLPSPASFKTLISDGASAWQEIGS